MEEEEHLGSTNSNEGNKAKKTHQRKRSRVESTSSTEDELDSLAKSDCTIGDIQYVEDAIRKCCENDPSKRVTKAITAEIMGHVADLSKITLELLTRNAYLKGVVDSKEAQISSLNKKLQRESEPSESYASIASKGYAARVPPISGINKRITTMAHVAVISPPDNCQKDVEVVKKEVMGLIDPGNEGIKIKGVRKRTDGKLVVETATAEDLQKVLEHGKLNSGGYKATRSGAMNPKVIIYDVPRELEPVALAEMALKQNYEMLKGITEESIKNDFIPRFRIGKKEGECTNWVVEVSPKLRNVLRSNERNRLYLQWQSCKIEDYRGVTRCYKCQQYGHVSKYCREEDQICSYCAKANHMHTNCPEKNRNVSPTCAACRKAKKKADHSVNDKSCPMYKMALDRIISRTDYGV